MDCYELKNDKFGSLNVSSSLFNSVDDKTPVADPLLCDARLKTFSPTPTNFNNDNNFLKQGVTPIMRMGPPSNSSTPRISDIKQDESSSNYNSLSLKTNETSETSGIGSITTDDSDQIWNNILSNLKGYNAPTVNLNFPQNNKIFQQQPQQQQASQSLGFDSMLENYGLGGFKESDLSLEDLLFLKQKGNGFGGATNTQVLSSSNVIQNDKLNELLQQEEQKYKLHLNEKLLSQNLLQQLMNINNTQQQTQAQQSSGSVASNLSFNQLLQKNDDKNLLQGLNKNSDLLKLLNSIDSNNLTSPTSLLNTCQTNSLDVMNDVNNMALYYKFIYGAPENEIEKAAYLYRNSANSVAQRGEERAQWTGNVTKSLNSNVIFSRKVFLGGVPWDITTDELICTFKIYGDLSVHWPNRDGGSSVPAAPHSRAPKAGYCYLLFESDIGVKRLMDHCSKLGNVEGCYYRMRSPKFKQKEVQVIPWVVSDSTYQRNLNVRIDNKKTVFVGALHGMITAEMLFTIMDTLFSNVVFAALDTDKYKYPIGSGRVSFSTQTSYLNAVTTNFVDVQTSRFNKTIQIDPYLEDSMCNHCFVQPGIYFCRSFECFRYFCPACWNLWHNKSLLVNHKPLRRSFKCSSSSNASQLSDFRG